MPTATHLVSDASHFVDTFGVATGTLTAGQHLVVGVMASSDFHANAFAWSISDTAGRTWTQRGSTAAAGSGNRRAEMRLYTAPVGVGTSSTTITVDAFATGAGLYEVGVAMIDSDPVALVQAVLAVAAASASAGATFGATPGSYQTALALAEGPAGGPTWNAAPTNFTSLNAYTEGGASPGGARWATSATIHATTVTQTVTAASDFAGMILVEWDPGLPTITQDGYRWGLDDGTESTHTWAGAEDTGITAAAGERRLLRVQLDQTNGIDSTAAYRLEYKRSDEGDDQWRSP